MEGLGIGRIVHYVVGEGESRAALVVRDWSNPATMPESDGMVNLEVHLDGDNDRQYLPLPGGYELSPGVWRATSVHYEATGTEKGTWHWPPRV